MTTPPAVQKEVAQTRTPRLIIGPTMFQAERGGMGWVGGVGGGGRGWGGEAAGKGCTSVIVTSKSS